MKCPYCGFEDTNVKDSRPTEDSTSIRRRRFCPSCNSRFTTIERVQLRELTVVKKSGAKKPFDRVKFLRAISTAVRKRSISEDQIEQMVNRVVSRLETIGESEVESKLIGEAIMSELSSVDPVAYVRFASVYRDFETASDFEKFIQTLDKNEISKNS